MPKGKLISKKDSHRPKRPKDSKQQHLHAVNPPSNHQISDHPAANKPIVSQGPKGILMGQTLLTSYFSVLPKQAKQSVQSPQSQKSPQNQWNPFVIMKRDRKGGQEATEQKEAAEEGGERDDMPFIMTRNGKVGNKEEVRQIQLAPWRERNEKKDKLPIKVEENSSTPINSKPCISAHNPINSIKNTIPGSAINPFEVDSSTERSKALGPNSRLIAQVAPSAIIDPPDEADRLLTRRLSRLGEKEQAACELEPKSVLEQLESFQEERPYDIFWDGRKLKIVMTDEKGRKVRVKMEEVKAVNPRWLKQYFESFI